MGVSLTDNQRRGELTFDGSPYEDGPLPRFSEDLFDPELEGSFSHFFREMSGGKLEVEGDVIPKVYSSEGPAEDYISREPDREGRYGEFNREVLREMKRAGCWRISFGIESGDQRTLDAEMKGLKLEQVERAVRLTVEAGKIVLAEFGYGGKLLPTFPRWLIDGTRPSRLAWLLKDTILPPVYWHGMLKGREWMVKPQMIAAGQTT